MVNIREITEDTFWLGGSDRRLALFENLFPLPDGVSYNSYLIRDEKNVLFDTADASIAGQFLENLGGALDGEKLDYLVILHMEPDHCAEIADVITRYPDVKLVGSVQTFKFLDQFFSGLDKCERMIMKEGDTLSTGKHTYHFITAPMVHWPEVLMAYDDHTKVLFSADAFGTFGALDGGIFADDHDFEKEYLDEARRYYSNIVGKYGPQVQTVLKKAAGLDIGMIAPLHGPVWRENIPWFIDKYQKWSTYTPEDDGIVVIYGSLYGHTESAAETAAAHLRGKSGTSVKVYDVSKTHTSYLISEVFRASKIVLFCPTYNNGIYLPMAAFLHDLAALNVQNRTFALAENGTWAPAAGKLMKEELAKLKNVTVLEDVLTIKSALHPSDAARLEEFVDAVVKG